MGLLDPQALEYFGLLGQSMLAGQSPNAGVNVGNAMMYADTEMRRKAAEKARLEEERQQAQIRQLAMDRAKREDDFRKALSGGFQPGTAPQQFNDALGDGSGGMIPGRGPSMDFSGAMQVDPLAGFQAQKQWQEMNAKAGPQYKEVNGRLVAVNPDGTVKEVYAAPEKPKFQKGDTRVIKSGRVEITQEWDGTQWKQLAKSSMDKPEGEAKPHYDPTLGGYVYPPKPGQAPSFVPIPGAPKKPGKAPPEAYLKQQAGVQNVTSALSEYVKALDGFSVSDLARPDKRAALGTVYNNALLQAKEAYNLGVLNGPDYAILQEVLTNPMSWKGAVTSNEALKAQANKMKELMRKVGEGAAAAHGISAPEGDQSDPLGLRK